MPDTATRHVLLIEDSADDAALIGSLLRRACPACQLHVAPDAARAIAYLAGEGEHAGREAFPLPALILLDLTLPGPSGLTVLEWRRARPEVLGVPVVVLTASKASAGLERAYELGADSYLVKPVTAHSLADTITALAPALEPPVCVLVVDDSAADRRLAAELLSRGIPGVEIAQAASIETLDGASQAGRLDAVITDFRTGSFSGIDTLRALKVRWPSCPVIVLTGGATADDLTRVLRAGASDYVHKDPRDLPRLASAVRSAIAQARARRVLIDSEARFRAAFEQAGVGISIVGLDGRWRRVNPRLCEILGYPEEELLGKTFAELTHPDDVEADREALDRQVRGELDVYRREKRYRRHDGSPVWVDLTATVVRDDAGRPRYSLAVTEDITDRKRAEAALRESEQRYRLLFRDAPIGVFHYDTALRITECNDRFVSILQSSRERLVGVDLSTLNDRRVLPALRAAIAGAEGRYEGPYQATTSAARVVVAIGTAPLRDENGAIVGAVGIVEDLTAHRQAEDALRSSEAKYRTLYESLRDGVVLVDMDGRIRQFNETYRAMLGYTAEELSELTYADLTPAAWHDVEARIVTEQILPRGYSEVYEKEYRRKDGTVFPVELRTFLIRGEDGRPAAMWAIVRDISERRALEEHLRQAQKMEAVGSLAGGVAHDFNNLLQAMLSQSQLVSRFADDPSRVVALVGDLEQEIRRGAALTRQLLLFSRRETARPERQDLNETLRDTARMLRRLVRENIALKLDLATTALPVEADRGQLQQVFMNLAVNASDAMPAGGTLLITTGTDGLEHVWCTFRDSGTGIAEEIRARIFEPFFTTKAAGGGTGLGLAVVHGIVTRSGGRIEVESTVGEGSAFTVVLPRAASPGETGTGAPAPPPKLEPGLGERLLLVEDEASAREGLLEILTTLGYAVTAVDSAEAAQALPHDRPFDLLLTDLVLPGEPGPQLAANLQERWPELKVVLMSGYTEDAAVRLASFAGMARFLQKPFDMTTLARELRAALAD